MSDRSKSTPDPADQHGDANDAGIAAPPSSEAGGERVAKVIARAGICSRRDAERMIVEGRVAVNGRTITSPALNIEPGDVVSVDGKPLAQPERVRVWRYHKPSGLMTTHRDPEGRPTVFDHLPETLPRVISVGRLDMTSEGLLLLTNDGELARRLELPQTAWTRRYRVRAFGKIDQATLDGLMQGITIGGVKYGRIEAKLEREQGDNNWLTMVLREGKNREIRKVLDHLGLTVNRLIRVSYGPFQLGELERGRVEEIPAKVLRDQLGDRLAEGLTGIKAGSKSADTAQVEHADPDAKKKLRATVKRKAPAGGRKPGGAMAHASEASRKPTPGGRRAAAEARAADNTSRGTGARSGDRPSGPGRNRHTASSGDDRPRRNPAAQSREHQDFAPSGRPRRSDATTEHTRPAFKSAQRRHGPDRDAPVTARAPRSAGSRPAGEGGPRSDAGGRPGQGARPSRNNRPGSDTRTAGSPRPAHQHKPGSTRPDHDGPKGGGRPGAGRPGSGRPGGDRPFGGGRPGGGGGGRSGGGGGAGTGGKRGGDAHRRR